MGKLKVCVYAICKNESSFVDRWMESMKEADWVVVTDTGSEDDTVQKLEEAGAIVYREEVKPWRFDTARNLSLEHVPGEADICVSTDLDEVFQPGWRAVLEETWLNYKPVHNGPVAKAGRYLYNWSLKPDGSPDVQFFYFKVHGRQDFRWKCPIHEFVEYVGELPLETVFIPGVVLDHYPAKEKSRSSYLPLLELAVTENPRDDRMRYYLGREYMYKGRWQDTVDTLLFYLAMPEAGWKEERCAAMRWIAEAYSQMGQIEAAYGWYFRAIAERPHMRDAYVEFSKLCYRQKDWSMCLFLGEEALKIKEKVKTYVNMGYAWDETPNDLCAIAAYWMGLAGRAVEHAREALKYAPEDKRLQKNLRMIEEKAHPI